MGELEAQTSEQKGQWQAKHHEDEHDAELAEGLYQFVNKDKPVGDEDGDGKKLDSRFL